MRRYTRWLPAMLVALVFGCVLGFYQAGSAQTGTRPTLANAPEDRKAMIENLEEIRNLLKEQNALLRSGQVKVIVVEMPKQ
jgi:hypothetical protein